MVAVVLENTLNIITIFEINLHALINLLNFPLLHRQTLG